MINKHAFLILLGGGIFLAIMGRACAHPAASDAPPSATWAPGPFEPLGGRVWLPVAGDICKDIRGDKTGADSASYRGATGTGIGTFGRATVRESRTVGAVVYKLATTDAWGVWSWVDVAVARAADAGKPTAAHTASATRPPTPTRPTRATRTARPTGTPTQGRMASPVPCGPGTVEPGLWTPWPACYPHGPSFTPTPAETGTPTPSDTPPASATWEPTPTRPAIEGPAPRVVPLPEVYFYRFPITLVWRVRR